jgi:hypothetical protein
MRAPVRGARAARAPAALTAGAAVLALAVLAATVPPATPARAGAARLVLVDAVGDSAGLLDVREVDTQTGPDALRFTVITRPSWRRREVAGRGFVVIHLDPRAGRRYYALLRAGRRSMAGILFRKRAGRDVRVGTLTVWRRDRVSVSVRIPAQKLGLAAGQAYAWRAQTLFTGRRCKRVCLDSVPDTADAVETLPAA